MKRKLLLVSLSLLLLISLATFAVVGGSNDTTTVADFEDGSTDVNGPEWSGFNDPNFVFSTTTTNPLDGSISGSYVPEDDTAFQEIFVTRSSPTTQDWHMNVSVDGENGAELNHKMGFYEGGDLIGRIDFNEPSSGTIGNINWLGASTTKIDTWDESTHRKRQIELRWDFPNNEVDIYLNGTNKGTYQFKNAAPGVDEFEMNTPTSGPVDDTEILIDDLGKRFTNGDPILDNPGATPQGGTKVSANTVSLEMDIKDRTFQTAQGDEVSVEFYHKPPTATSFSQVAQDTLVSNGTAQYDLSIQEGGTHEWYLWANDSYGGVNKSNTFSFDSPANLTIREETAPYDKIDSAKVEITFFEQVNDNPTIVNRTVSNGEVNLSGLPTATTFSASIRAPGYHNRTILLESLFDQQTAFLLNRSRDAIENTFEVQDRTGNFPPKDSRLIIQKAINRSLYGATPANLTWTNVGGDSLGADQRFVIDLEESDRYRFIVRNSEDDERVLGSYIAANSGLVTLEIGQVVADPETPNQVGWSANRTNQSGTVNVNFEYNDTSGNTNRLYIHIYEYGNESNELLSNTSFTGSYGTFSLTEPVPTDEHNTTWVVDWVAERPGENANAQAIVGPQRTRLSNLSPWIRAVVSIGSIWIVAGLFSRLNGDIGGVVVAALGGLFWWVGFLPSETGGPVVALALVTAGILFLNARRQGVAA